jgi:ribonuclease P protein component
MSESSTARASERFDRAHRLRTRTDFARVRQEGRTVAGIYLALGYARRTSGVDAAGVQPAAGARVGFSVGKRVGNAVMRNRVRRRLREVVRRRWRVIAPTWDLVVMARPPAAGASSAALARELDVLLSRAKVLAPGSEGTGI